MGKIIQSSSFIYRLFRYNHPKDQVSDHPGKYRKDIELPSKEKQSRIAYLMTSLDNKLVLEENTMARYMDEKQYILSQMFI